VDEDGEPIPDRVTGFDLTPTDVHDELLAMRIRAVYGGEITDIVNLRASEFLKCVAMVKAYSWSQPTDESRAINLERKRMGK